MSVFYKKNMRWGEVKKKTAVNSCNEWNPLKQVIDGRADGAMVQAPEIEIRR